MATPSAHAAVEAVSLYTPAVVRLLSPSAVVAPHTSRVRLHAVLVLIVLAVLGAARPAVAQAVRSFTARFTTNVTGDIRLLGNTLMYCPKPGVNGCTGNNNSFSMVHFKDTPDATVLNRSTADLALPAGATVVWAGLYWGGRSGSVNVPANRNQMKFRTPLTPAGT